MLRAEIDMEKWGGNPKLGELKLRRLLGQDSDVYKETGLKKKETDLR